MILLLLWWSPVHCYFWGDCTGHPWIYEDAKGGLYNFLGEFIPVYEYESDCGGKKVLLLYSVRQPKHSCCRWWWLLPPLSLQAFKSGHLTHVCPVGILYSMARRVAWRRCCRMGRSAVEACLQHVLCVLRTKRADVLWTFSRLPMYLLPWGSHAVLACSVLGRIKA